MIKKIERKRKKFQKVLEKIKQKRKSNTNKTGTTRTNPNTGTTKTNPNQVVPGIVPVGVAATLVGGTVLSEKNKGGKTFGEAFKEARAKGEGTKFTFNGKSFVAVTKDDLKKKGYGTDTAGLAAYNRAGGKKKQKPLSKEAAKSIVDQVNKNKKPKTRKQKRQERRKERIGFETFKERRQARRAARKSKGSSSTVNRTNRMKSGGIVSAKRSKPRGVGAAKRGFGKALG